METAKDARITHLLRQTDAYLGTLAQAVVAQQNDSEGGPMHETGFELIRRRGPSYYSTFA